MNARIPLSLAGAVLATSIAFAARVPEIPLRLFPLQPTWTVALQNILPAPPAFAGSRGYFPLQDDRIAAYDIHYGTVLWIAKMASRFQPALCDDRVITVSGDRLTALRDDTGTPAWQLPFDEQLAVPPVCMAGWVMAATSSRMLLAFHATDGVLVWRQDLGADVHSRPVVADERVFVPMRDGRIVARSMSDGAVAWETQLGGAPNDILAVDDRLFVGSNDNYFYALRAHDGQILWRWPTGADVIGQPVVDRQHVYFVSLDNLLRALDRNNGAQRWKRALPLRPVRGIVASDDILIVSGFSPIAAAFFMKDGTPAGTADAGGEIAATPYVVPGAAPPSLVLVARDLAQGAIIKGFARNFEPQSAAIAPLPGSVMPLPAPKSAEPEDPTKPSVPPLSPPTTPTARPTP